MHYTYYHMESFDNLKKASVQGLVTIETTRSPSHKSTGSHAGASKKNAKENLLITLNLLNQTDNKDSLMEAITHFHLGNISHLEKDNSLSLEYLERSLKYAPQYKRAKDLRKKIGP